MKKLLLFFLFGWQLLATDASVSAQQFGAENHYMPAVQKAKKQQKILLMVLVKEHCRWCKKLIDTTLSDPSVKKSLDQHFVTLIIDKDADYPEVFKESFFPSILYIDPKKEKMIFEGVGYVNAEDFQNNIHAVLNVYKREEVKR